MTKTYFISGGSRGIGEAAVRMLAGKCNVAFTYFKSRERALALEKELNDKFGGVLAIECDVKDAASVKCAIEKAVSRFKKLDVLVNNAGVQQNGILLDESEEAWREVFAVNVDGVFRLTKAALSHLIASKGAIVNVSSKWGLVGASGEVAYSASKAAVIGFTKALAKELAPMGVRVNAVAPGAIDTDMMKEYSKQEVEELVKNSIPLSRLGKPEEVASAIIFLAENEYISGATLSVDGLLGE